MHAQIHAVVAAKYIYWVIYSTKKLHLENDLLRQDRLVLLLHNVENVTRIIKGR